jgi:hypothetical protein
MPQAFRPQPDQQLFQSDFQLFDSSAPAQQVRHQQRPALAQHLAHTHSQQAHFYSNSAPSSSIGLTHQSHQSTRQQGSLLHGNSTNNVNQQSAQVVPMADLENYMTSFSSDLATDLDGVFDTSPLLGLEHYGGAEFNAMPTNAGQTVSPHELALNDSPSLFGSAPPSGALTDLTTPDMYNTSPDFMDNMDSSEWPTLFPEAANSVASTLMQRDASNGSFSSNSPSNSPLVRGVGSGRSERPTSIHRNSVGAVTKSRRRTGQLKEIVVDPSDKVAAKRARNTLAARESRLRKANHMEHLQAQIDELERENDELKRQLAAERAKQHGL